MPKWKTPFKKIEVGKGRMIRNGEKIAIITIGHVGNYAIDACKKAEEAGISVAHFDLRFVKPLDEGLLHHVFGKFPKVITVEDGTIMGGMGSAILEFMADHGFTSRVVRLGVPDQFLEQGTVAELHHLCGFDAEGIFNAISDIHPVRVLEK